MSRLSRHKKRAHEPAARPTAAEPAPIEVRVPGSGPGSADASVGGVLVTAPPGEEIQQAVLTHLHHIALSTGHAVLATIHDERIGYVVPLRVDPDGSSEFAGEPVAMGPDLAAEPPVDFVEPSVDFVEPSVDFVEPQREQVQEQRGQGERRDMSTHVMRPVSEPVRDVAPTFPLRAVPESAEPPVPGTVTAPTGEFGPPPVMEAGSVLRDEVWPEPASYEDPDSGSEGVSYGDSVPGSEGVSVSYEDSVPGSYQDAYQDTYRDSYKNSYKDSMPAPQPIFAPQPIPYSNPNSNPNPNPSVNLAPAPFPAASIPDPAPVPYLDPAPALDPDPKPTPARGFDAVAEAVLGDEPLGVPGDGAAPPLLAEPVARISDAVKSGRIDAAAELAERTVGEASGALGPEHPEVLRLRELTAYIAYLADDPVRAFQLSLDLVRIHRHLRDPEAAYGNVQSAAAAWRAVRNPVQGLDLGVELIALWTELTAEDGPAADDIEQLESARNRMGRLAERARRSAAQPNG